jgi:hypothetical protein
VSDGCDRVNFAVKKRVAIALIFLGLICLTVSLSWRLPEEPELTYRGKSLRPFIQSAVFDSDFQADSVLKEAFRSAKPAYRPRIEQECFHCVMKGLSARDNCLWSPYTSVKTNGPAFVTRWMPQWREPRKTRQATAAWVSRYSGAWQPPILSRHSCELTSPLLLGLRKSDPDPMVRAAAFFALGTIGVFNTETLKMMLEGLSRADMRDRQAATRWFGQNTVATEEVVPILLRGLEDDAMRSDYADALRAYGSKARFVVEPLITLARTNNPATSSVAVWALMGVDKEAAFKAGVR